MLSFEELIYFLANHFRKTADEIGDMSFLEANNWLLYFNKHPIGREDDYRAFFTGQCSGNLPKGSKPGDYFHTLKSKTTLEESAFDLVEDITKAQSIENSLRERDNG